MTTKYEAYWTFSILLLNTNILIITHCNLSVLLKIKKQRTYKAWEWTKGIGIMYNFPRGKEL